MSAGAAPLIDVSATVLVPCYNESSTISLCVDMLLDLPSVSRILLIDDGSNDGSADLCRALEARYQPRVQSLLLSPNRGKNAAIRAGLQAVSSEVVVIFDCDLTVPPATVERVISELRKNPWTLAYGSRLRGSGDVAGMWALRRLGNRLFARWVSLLLGHRISDVLCGLKGLPRRVLASIPASQCRWGDFDIFFGAADAGLRMVEIPLTYEVRRGGVSKMRLASSGLYFARLCASRTVTAVFGTTPRKRLGPS